MYSIVIKSHIMIPIFNNVEPDELRMVCEVEGEVTPDYSRATLEYVYVPEISVGFKPYEMTLEDTIRFEHELRTAAEHLMRTNNKATKGNA